MIDVHFAIKFINICIYCTIVHKTFESDKHALKNINQKRAKKIQN